MKTSKGFWEWDLFLKTHHSWILQDEGLLLIFSSNQLYEV
jgi:hypothetical protein